MTLRIAPCLRVSVVVGFLACAGGFGCEMAGFTEPAAPAECREIGARCQRPDGPVGVCLVAPCPPGEAAPCFVCTPQH